MKFWLNLFLVFFAVGVVYGHGGKEHAKDIGEVLGLLEKGRESFDGARDVRDRLGIIIAELIDEDANKLNRKINNRIADMCSSNQTFRLFYDAHQDKIRTCKNALKNNRHENSLLQRIANARNISREMKSIAGCSPQTDDLGWKLDDLYNDVRFHGKQNSTYDLLLEYEKSLNRILTRSQKVTSQDLKRKTNYWAKTGKLFSWSNYGHRIFFHWGWQVEKVDTSCINNCLARSKKDIQRDFFNNRNIDTIIPNFEYKVREVINQTWAEKKKRARIDFYRELQNVPACSKLSEDQKIKFLELAYCVHILGDYDNVRLEALMSIDDIVKFLISLCSENVLNIDKKSQQRNILFKMKSSIYKAVRASDRKTKAENLMKFLKKDMSKYIKRTLCD